MPQVASLPAHDPLLGFCTLSAPISPSPRLAVMYTHFLSLPMGRGLPGAHEMKFIMDPSVHLQWHRAGVTPALAPGSTSPHTAMRAMGKESRKGPSLGVHLLAEEWGYCPQCSWRPKDLVLPSPPWALISLTGESKNLRAGLHRQWYPCAPGPSCLSAWKWALKTKRPLWASDVLAMSQGGLIYK